MLGGQPWPHRLLQRNVAPWLVGIAETRAVRLWAAGSPEDLVQIGRAMVTRAGHPGTAPARPLQVEAFATSPAPRQDLTAQLAALAGRGAAVRVDLRPSPPESPVDLVSLGPAPGGGTSCAEACGAVRPGGRLLSHGPLEEASGFFPLDESGQLLMKPGPKGELPEAERAEYYNSLVTSHLGLAQALASRFEGRGEPREELEQVALAALTACARRYDPGRGVPFGGYAAQSVLGELKRHFRDCTWGAHVARPVQERYLALKEARESLYQSLKRTPKVSEVAAHLHVTDEEVVEAMEAGSSYWPLSLDRPHPSSGERTDIECPEDPIEHATDLDNLAAAIPQLTPLERLAIGRYFFEEQTQQSIADEIGVSQMQVSRIISRAVAHLRRSFVDT